uniref:membrane-spanning 4-domains subfamily A member 7 isoform X4 n=1 Tax=Myodes glareolus TaxID=447135 RepID=UPI002021075E|nr:membrane-spanning 4-domains subfamily A member 7 isoform X4 [Myodes glareolus]
MLYKLNKNRTQKKATDKFYQDKHRQHHASAAWHQERLGTCLPMDIVIHKRKEAGHMDQKDDLLVAVPKEATVLGFAFVGSLAIISGKIPIKPFALSSLASNAASSVVAAIGLFLLTHNLIALGTASPRCSSEKRFLGLFLYSESHYWMNEDKNCLLAYVSAMESWRMCESFWTHIPLSLAMAQRLCVGSHPGLCCFSERAGVDAHLHCDGIFASCVQFCLLVEASLLQQAWEYIFHA